MISAEARGPSSLGAVLAYACMLAAAVILFLLIDAAGVKLTAPEAAALGRTAAASRKPDALAHVLVALIAVVITGRILSVLLRSLGQPPVIGEVMAGILLGPSFLGWLWPNAAEFILPDSVAPYLGVISQLGVILYMFLVGLELNPGVLRERARSTLAISHAGIVGPFLLGAVSALFLYPRLSGREVSFTSFALFVGVSMSVTAFPVLARILTDQRMQRTRLGILALGCAAIGDVTAWCLLAFVVGVAQAELGGAFLVLGLTAAYLVFMFLIVRPLALRLLDRFGEIQLTPGVVAMAFAALLLSALTTEAIGIHALFGAFMLGAVLPHDHPVAHALVLRLENVVTVLLLPAFFAFTGMRTQIGLVAGLEAWALCGLILVVATVGKFGGTLTAARLTGLGWRESAGLGILMNTRGLMELIVLNIGLDLQIITPTLFAMMVLMALGTTLATTPILRLIIAGSSLDPGPALGPAKG